MVAELPRVTTLERAGPTRGRALLSYLREPATWSAGDRRLSGHSNKWESREVACILSRMGFEVDVVDWSDTEFEPSRAYDVVLGIEGQLHRLAALASPRRRLLHATGAHPRHQNPAELRRLAELRERRGVVCRPRRLAPDADGFERALMQADAVSLLGNAWTLSTYPEFCRAKVTCIPVSGSRLREIKNERALRSSGRDFLWFFGSGAVHKGLDRLLEVFAGCPDQTLHIVGNIGDEEDFLQAYRRELRLRNIRYHGMLDPAGRRFRRISRRVSFVVAPTCSEGTSPATVTMLQLGLYPIVSRATGVDLPEGTGTWLQDCTTAEIATAVQQAANLDEDALTRQIRAVQGHAIARYSRGSFHVAMRRHLAAALR
jgi:hypothetical protein